MITALKNEKRERTISNDAEEVIIPIAGTPEINSLMHLSMRKTLKDGTMEFLKDDADMEAIFLDEDPLWMVKSPEKKAELLLPYMNTRFLINETVALGSKNNNGLIRLEETRSATKDRYMSLAMLNYFFEKLSNKHAQRNQIDDFDESSWYDLFL